MARQRKPHRTQISQKKVGNSMYDEVNEFYQGTHMTVANQITISDVKTTKHFGLLLSTQQAVEEFQFKSGMRKLFSTEYQYHYWALVARIQIDDELLDIAIPTVLFNYKQEVSGAAVDFHLNDVEEASKNNQVTAEVIGNVLVQSSFGKFLQDTFKDKLSWMNVPMNTCHVHPGNMSSFSGTDYKKTINDPGICFPLAEPQGQPSFSSIICHGTAADSYAGKIVRTEYRYANKEGNVIKYNHGACLSYWKGYVVPGFKRKLPLLQSIFSNKEFEEKQDVVKPSYVTIDGDVVLHENAMLNLIISEFDKIDFTPHTEDIVASRIQTQSYRYVAPSYKTPAYNIHAKKEPTKYMTLIELREALIKKGYSAQVAYTCDYQKAKEMYDKLISLEALEKPKVQTVMDMESDSSQLDGDASEMTIDDKIRFLLANGVSAQEVTGKSIKEIDKVFEELLEQIEAMDEIVIRDIVDTESLNIPDYKGNEKIIMFLETHGLSREKIMEMTNEQIDAILEEAGF